MTGRSNPPRLHFTQERVINPSLPAVASPCIGVCTLDAAGYCIGCLRTGDEIGAWLSYSDQQRAHLVNDILPLREAQRDES